MEGRRAIEEQLQKKLHEVEALEDRLKNARIYVQALQDVLKLLGKDATAIPSALKAGSAVAQAREIILGWRKPVHVTAILEAMGRDSSRETRVSLASSLAAYVRRKEVFTRPAPNTFGLQELGHDAKVENDEPPEGFGQVMGSPTAASPATHARSQAPPSLQPSPASSAKKLAKASPPKPAPISPPFVAIAEDTPF